MKRLILLLIFSLCIVLIHLGFCHATFNTGSTCLLPGSPAPSSTYFEYDGSPVSSPSSPGKVFDVTHYGACPNGVTDSSKGFLETWKAACSHPGNSTYYVPEGTYFVGPISFCGPCYNSHSPLFEIYGTLIAPTSLSEFPNGCWIEFRDLNGLILSGRTEMTNLNARGAIEAWREASCWLAKRCIHLITSLSFLNVSNGRISRINLSDAKGFHIGIHGCKNVHVQHVTIKAPWNSPNTDGIHISRSTNINISSSTIGVGDDCVSIGPGSRNISVYNVQCGPGHGISVGSLGQHKNEEDVVGINVGNCTINGTQNGIRVKTWPGAATINASHMNFVDILMINVSNPIIIDQEYCPSNSCDKSKPSGVKLRSIYIKDVRGTYNSNLAVKLTCSSSVPCENINLVGIRLNCTKPDSPWQGRFSLNGSINGLQVINSTY